MQKMAPLRCCEQQVSWSWDTKQVKEAPPAPAPGVSSVPVLVWTKCGAAAAAAQLGIIPEWS